MKKRIFLKTLLNMERRFFFNRPTKGQVNKIVHEYFYLDQKMDKVVCHSELDKLLQVEQQGEQQISQETKGQCSNLEDNHNKGKKWGEENKHMNDKNVDHRVKEEISPSEEEIFLSEKLKDAVNNYIGNYVHSSKCFTHLCVFYIYNNEKKKFLDLMKNFSKYCFGYEDLFILFYLICKINYKNEDILQNILNVFEIYYYKIDSTFSYPISELFFAPHTNLNTALNSLPLIYKIKLLNADRCFNEWGKNFWCTYKIGQGGGEPAAVYKGKGMQKSGETAGNGKSEKTAENAENAGNGKSEKIGKIGKIENFAEGDTQTDRAEPQQGRRRKEHAVGVDDSEVANILENLQDVDMENYEKDVSKESVKFINLNVKREKQKMKMREMKFKGLKLKSTLLTQIKKHVEKMKDIKTKGGELTEEKKMFEIKEILTIFIHDKELAHKNMYIKDMIEDVIKCITNYGNTPILCKNMLTFLVFMDTQKYHANKKLNKAIEFTLAAHIGSMDGLSEQTIYDFINEKTNMEEHNGSVSHTYDVLHFLYNQDYTYNFNLYDENIFYENKFNNVTKRLLKNFFFLVSYMLRLSFLKLPILKSYLNSFDFFFAIFIKNENISSFFHIAHISFICESFVQQKIIDLNITKKLMHIVHHEVQNFLNYFQDGKMNTHEYQCVNKRGEKNAHISESQSSTENLISEYSYILFLNDILTILHFLHFFNLNLEKLHTQLFTICLGNLIYLNDTQKLILFNCIEGIKKRTPSSFYKPILNYFMYEKNLDFFLARNKNIQKDSLGLLLIN
ncbi:hypothetical protein, conserved [Plasmodium gonderi]|uniref:Uncharacterized protein n=1 Tax=Plasmodium gonderi TaxID=77519 RepID=A0A1Y1JH42_PLAGO|nr:hypothetical protein, conserved [Plasmodium gonderi]GAW81831.1 hypothetical protein, conserved [Plasmodium gonderi]